MIRIFVKNENPDKPARPYNLIRINVIFLVISSMTLHVYICFSPCKWFQMLWKERPHVKSQKQNQISKAPYSSNRHFSIPERLYMV